MGTGKRQRQADGAPVQGELPRFGAGRNVCCQLARLIQQPLARHHAVHQAQLRLPASSVNSLAVPTVVLYCCVINALCLTGPQ